MKNKSILFRSLSEEICSDDYDRAEIAVRKLISLKDDALCFKFLKDTFIDHTGVMWVNPQFVVACTKQQKIDYAFWQLIALAPETVCLRAGINRKAITEIRFRRYGPSLEESPDVFAFPASSFYAEAADEGLLLARFPSEIWRFPALQKIDAIHTGFNSLPESVGKLSSLNALYIRGYQNTVLPESIGKLAVLNELIIEDSLLSELPESLANLRELHRLILDDNRFTEIPAVIGKLKSLRSLSLSKNRISKIPESLTACRNLETLNLSRNNLKTLPISLAMLSNLQELDLSYNQQLGKIPVSITALGKLRRIDISECDKLKLSRRIWFTREDMEDFFREISDRKISEPRRHDQDIFVKPLWPIAVPSHFQDPQRMIFEMLNTPDRDVMRSGFNLLLGSGDPVLTGLCLDAIPLVSQDEVSLMKSFPDDTADFIGELLTFLNSPDCKAESGPGTWRSAVKNFMFPGDYQPFVDLFKIFPSLRSLGLHFQDSGSDFHPRGYEHLNSLSVRALNGLSIRVGNNLKNCKFFRVASSVLREELVVDGLPALVGMESVQTGIGVLKIRNCRKLESVFISGPRIRRFTPANQILPYPSKVSISGCPDLKSIVLRIHNIDQLEISGCPALEDLSVEAEGVSPLTIKFNGPSGLRSVTIKKCGLTGVPSFILRSKRLEFLSLEENVLTDLPRAFGGLKKLTQLRLSGNRLTEVPDCISELRKLEWLELGWQTNEQPEKSTLKELPASLSRLKRLQNVCVTMPELNLRRAARIFRKNRAHLFNPPLPVKY